MKMFKKDSEVPEVTVVKTETPVVVPNGSLVIVDGRVFRAEAYGLVEVIYQYLPTPEEE